MGNCCRSQSSTTVWAGDDWGSFSSKHRHAGEKTTTSDKDYENHDEFYHYSYSTRNSEKMSLLGGEKKTTSYYSSGGLREVKIKMKKKEMDDIVRKLEMEGLTLEQVLSRLVNDEMDHHHHHHHSSWRPSLQSIPELD